MSQNHIEIIGARENNLKNIDLKIPKKKITIFTGVSGSGKSSVVFDTIARESSRLLNETFPAFIRNFMPKYDRPDADEINNISPSIVIDQRRIGGNSRSTVGTITDIDPILRVLFSRLGSPYVGGTGHFSFNLMGMCKNCEGIGRSMTMDLNKAIDFDKSLNQGAILLPGYKVDGWWVRLYTSSGFFDNDKKIKDYNKQELDKLLYAKDEKLPAFFQEMEHNATYMGLVERFERTNIRASKEKSEKNQQKIRNFIKEEKCKECGGTRYKQEVSDCKINGYNISDFQAMEARRLLETIKSLEVKGAEKIIANLISRIEDLIHIGLNYISLNRETSTLSGGESQRIKIVKNLKSSLTDILYIFDEPSIGLHPKDVSRLGEILIKLRDRGNTVLVVEHDPDIIKIADHVIDMGPKAGSSGGQVVYEGNFDNLKAADTLTAKHLHCPAELKANPRKYKDVFTTRKSSLNNLKNISVSIPKGIFTVVTGVAGSGKSTLIHRVFAAENPSIVIDQQAVSANSRSNPATYTGIMDSIRSEFAAATGVSPSLFSFNSEGACPVCAGMGRIEIEMAFMDSTKTLCEECDGKRFKKEVLDLTFRGQNISSVMNMTIAEALEFFTRKEIKNKLKHIEAVGLDYLTLGQPLNTLSGGECQRIKLAKELNKKGNIYILDEPTTGLHFSDITNVLEIINRLVDKNNTVIAIEHNLDIIRSADWIIDMGPGAGTFGGEIVYEGIPADIKKSESVTGEVM